METVMIGDIHGEIKDPEMRSLLESLHKKVKSGEIKAVNLEGDGTSLPENLIGKRVIVKSHRVNGATGNVVRYLPRTHHYWVWLDKPIKTKTGRKSNWHKCNAGNCRLFIPGIDDQEQLSLKL